MAMKKSVGRTASRTLATAALGGLLAGSAGLISGCQQPQSNPPSDTSATTQPSDKHACKGQNSCKGLGGCKTDAHACKGQNSCKGQGGCATQ